MEKNPLVSTGVFIKDSDPMISTGIKKKDMTIFFNNLKKRWQYMYRCTSIYNYLLTKQRKFKISPNNIF